jgi:hypothetical protein
MERDMKGGSFISENRIKDENLIINFFFSLFYLVKKNLSRFLYQIFSCQTLFLLILLIFFLKKKKKLNEIPLCLKVVEWKLNFMEINEIMDKNFMLIMSILTINANFSQNINEKSFFFQFN